MGGTEGTTDKVDSGHQHVILSTEDFLSQPIEEVFSKLGTSKSGLTSKEAEDRIKTYGRNEFAKKRRRSALEKFLLQLKSPLVIILLFASLVSAFFGEIINAGIIFFIIFLSLILLFYQESKAEKAAETLKEKVTTTATVLRDQIKQEVKLSDIVPGDILFLSAGDIVPADARVFSAKDLFINQSALTGESFPVEKVTAPLETKSSQITDWDNFLFLGTSVVSGTANAVAVRTGSATEYGKISKKLVERAPETEFERGLRRFGFLIMEVTFILVIFVFFINALLRQHVLEALLFSLALAVGLTPELLPMILSVNLSNGAISMSKKGVIVKRLASIQNFGSMDVLCTDKTGTLTENKITLIKHIDVDGKDDEKVLLYSFLNSSFQTGLRSPLDDAILVYKGIDIKDYQKIDEVPFDFTRRRVSVVVENRNERILISKGAPEEIFQVCTFCEIEEVNYDMTSELTKEFEEKYYELSTQGFRVLGVSYKRVKEEKKVYCVDDEVDMVFLGFIAFIDPPKETVMKSLQQLRQASIELKILTGDNEIVTRKVCEQLGFDIKRIVLGKEISQLTDEALARVVEQANIFARVTPAQKGRIISALRNNGHVVGFLGDGINDAPSMKISDVGISVDNAVDVAKESADIILLHKDLTVLADGVLEGRKTFGNTMKYIMMGTSSNFGNMFSVAGASIFLPFLPMLPIQILLNNLLYDFSELTIPTDNVDQEYLSTPKRWDISFIRRFMITLGPISSIFDFLTFFIMWFVFHASAPLFQTAWFLESLASQSLVVFVIRTRETPFYKSRPSKFLLISTLGVVAFALILPLTPIGRLFKFEVPPFTFFIILAGLLIVYLALVDLVKRWFYRHYSYGLEVISKPNNDIYT